jgi:hypothetical protein
MGRLQKQRKSRWTFRVSLLTVLLLLLQTNPAFCCCLTGSHPANPEQHTITYGECRGSMADHGCNPGTPEQEASPLHSCTDQCPLCNCSLTLSQASSSPILHSDGSQGPLFFGISALETAVPPLPRNMAPPCRAIRPPGGTRPVFLLHSSFLI